MGDRRRTMHVVEAADEARVRLRLAEDPWAKEGLLHIGSIEPWELWLDGRRNDREPVSPVPPSTRP